ncbi:MAG: GNAT family N-acetyltransferase [Muricomes sp.]
MNTENMLCCIDAYLSCFCSVEQGKNFVRFRHDELPDMYDHNLIVFQSGLDLNSCEIILRGEIENRKAQGHNFCMAQLMPSPDQDLSNLDLPMKPSVSRYIIFTSHEPENLHLDGRKDCIIRKVTTPEIARDNIMVGNSLYDEETAAEFGQRKGKRLSQVYLQPGGVDSFVCYHEEEPVGRADLLVYKDWAMIEYLVTLPSKQRQGFGTAILRDLISEAVKRGAQNILLVADADDTPREMYQKLGFQENTGRTSLFFQWEN